MEDAVPEGTTVVREPPLMTDTTGVTEVVVGAAVVEEDCVKVAASGTENIREGPNSIWEG